MPYAKKKKKVHDQCSTIHEQITLMSQVFFFFFNEAKSWGLGDLRKNDSLIVVNQMHVTAQVQFVSWTDDSYE